MTDTTANIALERCAALAQQTYMDCLVAMTMDHPINVLSEADGNVTEMAEQIRIARRTISAPVLQALLRSPLYDEGEDIEEELP